MPVNEPLPELLDAAGLQAELGVKRAAAEAIMRQLPVVQFENLRKVYCKRSDVAAYLEVRTFTKEQVPASRAHPWSSAHARNGRGPAS
jgi:hypothetical protein